MYLGCGPIAISFQSQRSKVKVTRSPQRSKLEIAVTPLIFELQQNLKKHNVVLLNVHLYDIINFRYHFRFKRSPEVENRKCEIAISIFVSFQHSSNLIAYLETTCRITIVWNIILRVDDVIDDVTAERQIRSSIFMFNYIEPSCHSNFITNGHFLMILTRYMWHSDLILNCEFQGQRSNVKVMTAEMLKSKITKTGIAQSIFKKNLKDHNVVLLNAYLHGIIDFRCNFRFKSSFDLKMAAIF